MKRIAIISLIITFLTANYAYATFSIEELAQTIEQAQYQELTQEEVEELFVALITSIDSEKSRKIAEELLSLNQINLEGVEVQSLQCTIIASMVFGSIFILFVTLAVQEPLVGIPLFVFVGMPILLGYFFWALEYCMMN